MSLQDVAATVDAPPPGASPSVPRTELHQPDPGLLPGRPLELGEMADPPPAACGGYVTVFYPFFVRALFHPEELRTGFLMNMTQLEAYTLRSKRWIYRGLRVLAAHGCVYSTPVGPEEGVDRRRHRVRYWLRCDARIPTAETVAALKALSDLDPSDGTPFPAGAGWAGHGRAIRVPPEDLAQAAARAEGAPTAPFEVPPDQLAAAAARAAGVPPLAPESGAAPVDPRQEPPGSGSASDSAPVPAVSVAAPVGDRQERLVTPSPSFSHSFVDKLVLAVEARLGVVRPHVFGRADADGGTLTLERADNFRHREAFRKRALAAHPHEPGEVLSPVQHDPLNLPQDSEAFLAPDHPEFQPGVHGWHYIAGCWHGPVTVCRCFVKEFVEAYLRATAGGTQAVH